MDHIEILAKSSKLPEKVDVEYWQTWLANNTGDYLNYNREAFREI
jgi:hypothetical protein